MKKCLFSLILLFLLSSSIAEAVEMSTSVPSGSQYAPGRNYRFQIYCDDIANISSVVFEWNGNNYTQYTSPTVQNIGDTYWINLIDLAVGSYPYKWLVNNTSDVLTFSDTYDILINSSAPITLTLDGTAGNKSYRCYSIANFVATLNIPNKIIKLESTYPSFTTQYNTSVIYYSVNLTELGISTITASWNGDLNYSSSSKTYYFDSGPPQISGEGSTPNGPVGYVPNIEYKFQITCKDATLNNVWFESNYTGTMKSYYSNSDPPLQNSSGVFWITLKDLGARKFSYKWHAKDSLNDESSTDFINYEILKMNSLVMDLMPSINIKEGTQVTANCYSINSLEVPASKFKFYKNSDLIENISSSIRMDTFLLSAGTYNFTCNTSGTGNYSNQSITRTITVSAALPEEENITGELRITSASFPSIKTGESGEASFNLVNNMLKNIFNITVKLFGISSEWYNITSQPSHIYSGETKEVKIIFNIPSDAEIKTYSITIETIGNTSDKKIVTATKILNMDITGVVQNTPPTLFVGSSNTNIAGSETVFSLEWSDDYGLSGYIFSTNNSGFWENDSWVQLTGKNGWINITKKLNSNVDSVIVWKVYANDSNGKWSMSDEYIVETTAATTDFNIFFIIILVVILIVIFLIIIRKRKITEKEEEIEYVYNRDEIYEEKA